MSEDIKSDEITVVKKKPIEVEKVIAETVEVKTEETVVPVKEEPVPIVELNQQPITNDKREQGRVEDIVQSSLCFLNADMKELDVLAENYTDVENLKGENAKAWLSAFQQGIDHLVRGNSMSDSVIRANSAWRQRVAVDGENLSACRPKFGSTTSGIISGEKALMKATSLLGIGGVTQIPLWHTGIWVSIKAPNEGALLELERRISNEKISLGRYTSGMVFSNTSVYTVMYVVNFVLNHVYDASVKNLTQDNLKSIIKITDIPSLVWGMLCTIHTNGYKYNRPCTANPAECQHVVSGDLSLPKLFWVDNNSLTEKQKRHMSKRTEKFTEADLKDYEKEHSRGGPFTININDNLSLRLKVPTLQQYETSGFAWVTNIVSLLENSLSISTNGKERDDYITDQGRLSALRQYGHWVNEISVGEDSIQDIETIELFLDSLSGDEELADSIFEKIGKYIDDSILALVAIPKYVCPACGGEQVAEVNEGRHPHLLPIDVVKTFFTLLDQRIYKALTVNQAYI